MSTYVHGIAASENIDTSGEVVSISGLDISSLTVDGVLNWNHKKDLPEQIVGKILEAKKIFSEEDCENEHHLYFWNKCKTPYLYIMGELMDDYKDSAKEVAGMFRYDADRKDQQRPVMNFSIEGGKIHKEGMIVTHSVARKVTLTELPCNKAAIAEMVSPQTKASADDIFKTEPNIEIQLFKVTVPSPMETPTEEKMAKHAEVLGLEPMNKNVIPFKKPLGAKPSGEATIPSKTNNPGSHLGQTKSGKNVFSHAKIHEYHGFSSRDHQEAANLHHEAAEKAKSPEAGKHHLDKRNLHLQAAKTKDDKHDRFMREKEAREKSLLGKSLTAGSGNVAPSELKGGSALAKESLSKKSNWVSRADTEYKKWEKREEFRAFMQKKLPKLTLGEIDAIGKTIALKKSVEAEQALGKLEKALKFGSAEDQKTVASAIAERAKNPPKKAEPKKPAPHLKGVVESEVSHTTPYSEKHETVHLKSGHELDGHPKGKFKAGDKVVAKPHLMGTHLLEHKK